MQNEIRNKYFWTWLSCIIIGIVLILSIFFMEERHNSAQPSTQGTAATSPQSIQNKDSVGQVNK